MINVRRSLRYTIPLLCLFGALRVFFYAAIFPFFNNVDEQAHFDLVVKYSHVEVPRGLAANSAESARYIAYFRSPEFVRAPDQFADGRIPPPLWLSPEAVVKEVGTYREAQWQNEVNHEALTPPLYYVCTGVWMRLGQALGVHDLELLYWIRFLNIPVTVALVWLGFVLTRLIFPNHFSMQWAVPMLIAAFPQDTFYSIQCDVLSPLCFGLGFLFLVRVCNAGKPSVLHGAVAGLTLALTYLTKTSNLPFLLMAGAAVTVRIWRWARLGEFRSAWPSLLALLCFWIIPIAGWLVWTYHIAGDLTGSEAKIKLMDWTHKPLAHWWVHPLFTFNGAGVFFTDLMKSFWRGEFVWHGKRLALDASDTCYWVLSLAFPAVTFFSLFSRQCKISPTQRWVLFLSSACFVSGICFLALLSLAFDFGECAYPSTSYPYFTSGRLISGSLLPFLLLFVFGLDRVVGSFKSETLFPTVVIGMVLLMSASEILVTIPVFASRYNWFHL